MKGFSQGNWCSGRHSNWAPPNTRRKCYWLRQFFPLEREKKLFTVPETLRRHVCKIN